MTMAMDTPEIQPAASLAQGAVRVVGRVRRPLVVSLDTLRRMETETRRDIPIYCGTGDPKGSIASCRGVLLENVIRMADVAKDADNDTKKMFIVASADDGYTVVFSWQEIFNTPVGGGVMILIERDGRPLGKAGGDLALISAEDFFTGSRYVKGLTTIELRRAD